MAGKRSIFEEVSGPEALRPTPQGGMIAAAGEGARGAVRAWLMIIFGLVAVMIAVGGLTRLTDSGLSITEWNPVMGTLPPLNDAHWQSEFAKYQASPQGQIMNAGMTLEEFKAIYWWEWGHRFLGRVIGLVWAGGFAWLAFTKCLPKAWAPRGWTLGVLIGLQGLIGWLMVASGLKEAMISVENYMLALHLAGAFVIYGLIAWWVFELGRPATDLLSARRNGERRLRAMATGVMHLLFLQIILGAFVAGIDAGRNYPTWPDMNGSFFPADAFDGPAVPLWQNAGVVQFTHRLVAYALLIVTAVAWWAGRRSAYRATRRAFHWMAVMMVVQVVLGIGAAVSAAALPEAITHQVGAVILWVLVLRARFLSGAPIQGSIREGTA